MTDPPLDLIPLIQIQNYGAGLPHLLVMNLDEFVFRHREIISKPHRISYYEIILLTDGDGEVWIDSNNCNLSSRSLISLSKGRVETFESFNNAHGYIILFSEEYINKYPGDLKWINNLDLFNPVTDFEIINLSKKECLELIIFIKKIDSEIRTKKEFLNEEIIINLLKTLILFAERFSRFKSVTNIRNQGEHNLIVEFKNKLEEQYRSSKAVKFYADLLNTTPKKLNQSINNFYGESTKQIIEKRVFLESKRLLIHTNQTIKEIGYLLGFNDPANFNRFFKKNIELTPAEYRSLNKTKT